MALPKFEKDISYISKLADQPNDTAGNPLSAAQLKERFDAAGNDIKEYINTVLIPFLQGESAAANLGLKPISGITDAADLQSALETLKRAIDNTAAGELPDASLTGGKLVPEAITNRELAPDAVQGKNVAPKTLTGANAADKSFGADVFEDEFLQHRHIGKYVIEDENIADNTIDAAGKIKDSTITAKKYAPLSIPTGAHQEKAVTRAKLANDALYSPIGWNTEITKANIGQTMRTNWSAATTFKLMQSNSSAIDPGAEIAFLRWGAADVNVLIVGSGGVRFALPGETGFKTNATLKIPETFGLVALKKIETSATNGDTWLVTGNVEVVS